MVRMSGLLADVEVTGWRPRGGAMLARVIACAEDQSLVGLIVEYETTDVDEPGTRKTVQLPRHPVAHDSPVDLGSPVVIARKPAGDA